MPVQLSYIKTIVGSKDVQQQSDWNFVLGERDEIDLPISVKLSLQQRDRWHYQPLKIDTFCRLSVKIAQCIFGTENYPDTDMDSEHAEDKFSQGYT